MDGLCKCRDGLEDEGDRSESPWPLLSLSDIQQDMDEPRKYRDGLEDEGDRSEFPLPLLLLSEIQQVLSELPTYRSELEDVVGDWLELPPPPLRMQLFQRACGGRPLISKIFVLSEQQSLAPPVLVLWLDSGATHHAVGDPRILYNLRDPPAGIAVRAADGVRLPVHKIGDIQTQNIKIRDVYLVPGLQENLISVRQLAKDDKIVSTFYENYVELCREGGQVGGAIADSVTSLYRLRYYCLPTPTGDPEAGTSRYIREEAMDAATARRATSRSRVLQLHLSLSISTSTESKQQQGHLKQRDNVFQCRTCGRCFPTFQALGGHRTSHLRQQRVHANDRDLLDLLGARSGKGAAQTVHRCYFTGEVLPAAQAPCRHRATFHQFHVADGDSRWPFKVGDSRWALADYSETSLAEGERWHCLR